MTLQISTKGQLKKKKQGGGNNVNIYHDLGQKKKRSKIWEIEM